MVDSDSKSPMVFCSWLILSCHFPKQFKTFCTYDDGRASSSISGQLTAFKVLAQAASLSAWSFSALETPSTPGEDAGLEMEVTDRRGMGDLNRFGACEITMHDIKVNVPSSWGCKDHMPISKSESLSSYSSSVSSSSRSTLRRFFLGWKL